MHHGSHQLPAAPASSPHPLERKNGLSALRECRGRIEAHSQLTRIDLGVVERCREVFGEVFNAGTQEEKRQFVRLFIKKIDLNPDTGDILMHLFGRPPLPASRQTPASGETGVCIGLVAGARDEVQQRKSGREPEVVRVMFRNRGSALVPLGAVPATDS